MPANAGIGGGSFGDRLAVVERRSPGAWKPAPGLCCRCSCAVAVGVSGAFSTTRARSTARASLGLSPSTPAARSQMSRGPPPSPRLHSSRTCIRSRSQFGSFVVVVDTFVTCVTFITRVFVTFTSARTAGSAVPGTHTSRGPSGNQATPESLLRILRSLQIRLPPTKPPELAHRRAAQRRVPAPVPSAAHVRPSAVVKRAKPRAHRPPRSSPTARS